MNQHHSISYDLTLAAYKAEISRLKNAIIFCIQNQTISNIFDYDSYIKKLSRSRIGINALLDENKGTFIIDPNNKSKTIWSLINTAHIGACSTLLKGQKFTEAQFQPAIIQKNAIDAFPKQQQCTQQQLDTIAGLLSRLDASRSAQILKSFGLFTRKSNSIIQLALGCGSGINDIESIHQICNIKKINESKNHLLSFDYSVTTPKKITLIDADIIHKERYQKYNLDNPSIQGIIGDMQSTLSKLTEQNSARYNLVSILRMEHRMIPDLFQFFSTLNPLIAKDCDLIFSIGLGEDLNDFKARTDLVAKLYNFLKQAKMNPVVFKMHDDGDLQHQQNSIKFGHPILASYQMLYCKLKPSLINTYLASH